jgi:hypothetical protein
MYLSGKINIDVRELLACVVNLRHDAMPKSFMEQLRPNLYTSKCL